MAWGSGGGGGGWGGGFGGSGGGGSAPAPDLGPDAGALTLAQNIARLQQSPDKTSRDLASYYLSKYGAQIPQPLKDSAGVKEDQSQALAGFGALRTGGNQKPGLLSGFGSALGFVGKQLGRLQQGVYAGALDVGSAVKEHLPTFSVHVPGTSGSISGGTPIEGADSSFGNVVKGLSGNGNMDLGALVGKPGASLTQPLTAGLERLGAPAAVASPLGKIGNAGFNIIANTATDPLIALGGIGAEARTGMGILGEAEKAGTLAEGTTEAIKKAGFSKLAPEVQEAATTALQTSPNLANMVRQPSFVGQLLGKGAPTADEIGQGLTEAVQQGGRSGVRLAGTTILPTAPISGALNLIPGVEAARGALSAVGEKIAPTFSREAQLTRDVGAAGAEAIPALQRAQMARDAIAAKDAFLRSKPYIDLPAEEQALVIKAAEGGKDAAAAIRPQLSDKGQALLDEFTRSTTENAKTLIGANLARPNSDLEVIKQAAAEAAHSDLTEKAAAKFSAKIGVEQETNALKQAQDALAAHKSDLIDRTDQGLQITDTMLKKQGALERDVQVAQGALKQAQQSDVRALTNYVRESQAIPEKASQAGIDAMNKAAQSGTFLKPEDTYVKRFFTDYGQKAYDELVAKNPAIAKQMSGDLASLRAGGSLTSRTMTGTNLDVNDQWAKIFSDAGIVTPEGAKFIEDNPALIMARSNMEVARAASEVRYLTDLAKVPSLDGKTPLVLMGDGAKEEADKAGYLPIPGNIEAYAPPKLLPELKNLGRILSDDAELKQVQKVFRHLDSTWSRFTTPFSLTKRYVGHTFNSILGEGLDTLAIDRAASLQKAASQAMAQTGRALGPEFEAKFLSLAKNERDAQAFLQATNRGVMQTGMFPQNVEGALNKGLGVPGKVQELFPTISELQPMDKLLELNKTLDNNIRLAHFLKAFDRTGSFDQAEQSVYKYLFDYSNLTKTEQSIKQYARFYTYLRKNTPLQVLGLLEKPGLYAGTFHVKQGIMQTFPQGKGALPQWALEAGGIPTSAGVIGMDMPFEHAAKAITPALQAATMIPGIGNVVKSVAPGLQPEGGAGEVLRGVLGNMSGGAVSLVKAATEQATGRSLSSGGPISKIGTDRIRQVVNQLIPVTSKANALVNSRGGNPLTELAAKIANVNYTPSSDQVTTSEFKRQARAVADSIASLKANGVPIPDHAQLQLLHLVPSAAQALILQRLDEIGTKTKATLSDRIAKAKVAVGQ